MRKLGLRRVLLRRNMRSNDARLHYAPVRKAALVDSLLHALARKVLMQPAATVLGNLWQNARVTSIIVQAMEIGSSHLLVSGGARLLLKRHELTCRALKRV